MKAHIQSEPDRAALEFAHRAMRTAAPLEEILRTRSLEIILKLLARRHMQRRSRVDVKKLQAHDND